MSDETVTSGVWEIQYIHSEFRCAKYSSRKRWVYSAQDSDSETKLIFNVVTANLGGFRLFPGLIYHPLIILRQIGFTNRSKIDVG